MALWVCERDGVRYAVGAPYCPQCGAPASEGHQLTEVDDMPKTTKFSGATILGDNVPRRGEAAQRNEPVIDGPATAGRDVPGGLSAEEKRAQLAPADAEGGERSSDGTRSGRSQTNSASKPDESDSRENFQSSAPTTASRSAPARTDSPTAPSTGGARGGSKSK